MALPKSKPQLESLPNLVARIYDGNDRDRDKAVDALVIEIRKRPALHEEIFRYAAKDLIDKQIGKDRRHVLAGGDIGSVSVADNDDKPGGAPDGSKCGSSSDDTPPRMKHEDMPSHQSEASVKARAEATRRFAVRLTGLYLTTFLWDGKQIMLGKATPEQLRPIARNYHEQGATMVRRARWLEHIIASAKDGKPIHKSLTLKDLERLQREANESAV